MARQMKVRPRTLAARPTRRLVASRRPTDRRMSLVHLTDALGVPSLLPKNAGAR
jgi:hypothetical protein